MRWLIRGGDGQLGKALEKSVAHRCPENTVRCLGSPRRGIEAPSIKVTPGNVDVLCT